MWKWFILVITICYEVFPKFRKEFHISSCFVTFLPVIIEFNAKKLGKQKSTKAKTKTKNHDHPNPANQRKSLLTFWCMSVFFLFICVFTEWFYKNGIMFESLLFLLENSWQYFHRTVVFDRRETVKLLMGRVFVSFSG